MSVPARLFAIVLAVGAALAGGVTFWRRNPRTGTHFVNAVVNPFILREGLAGGSASELGMLEHVGRRSGLLRRTPVHPEPTPNGFRILVPLGGQSEWARNVLAAGRCRLVIHEHAYELDAPAMVEPREVAGLPTIARRVMAALGFQYLELRLVGPAASPGA